MMWSCQSSKLASFQSGSQLLVLDTFRSSARKVWKHDMRYSDSVFEVQKNTYMSVGNPNFNACDCFMKNSVFYGMQWILNTDES